MYLIFLNVTLHLLQAKRHHGKSFRSSRETIGITSNTVDTPVTASRKQLIRQVIHLGIRNTAREEFEGPEGAGGCYQLWINRAKFPSSRYLRNCHTKTLKFILPARTDREIPRPSIYITIRLIKRLSALVVGSFEGNISSEVIDFCTLAARTFR